MNTRVRIFCAAAVLVAALWGSAWAIPYTDVYDAGPEGLIGIYMSEWGVIGATSVSWTFDLRPSGFDPAAQDIASANVKLCFLDDIDIPCSQEEWATLDLGGSTNRWEVDTGSKTFQVESFSSLNETGQLFCTLTAVDGDFLFKYATLTAEGCTPAPVPEPATLLLLGSGLLGVAGFRMKKG